MSLETNVVHTGDCFDVLQTLADESVHAVVSDPPYGLAFMGRDWDDFKPKEYQEWCERWAREVKRVLKPGGHMLAFSGNRTHHRLFTGVEDAGFEIRDTLTWHYGSGFPKASDISKTIDKRAGAERKVTSVQYGKDLAMQSGNYGNSAGKKNNTAELKRRDKPATDAAKKWDGWKTGLKPSTEFVVMARKPYDGATVDSVLEHGTGALNIDGTRINAGKEYEYETDAPISTENSNEGWTRDAHEGVKRSSHEEGRYPANLMFDEVAAEQLDAKVGDLHESSESTRGGDLYGGYESEGIKGAGESIAFGDSGGPSRYFYTSKATQAERTLDGKIDNAHPTVKPGDLMQWLVKLVTAENQIVLDPFAGSGTTLRAAKDLGRQFIGIERQPKWADVARVRAGLTPDDPSTVRDDADQSGLEAYD